MGSRETLYQVTSGIATITLNRPEKLNAWTAVMEEEVRSRMDQANQDASVRVVVLTGAGRGFCAGADMALLNDTSEALRMGLVTQVFPQEAFSEKVTACAQEIPLCKPPARFV